MDSACRISSNLSFSARAAGLSSFIRSSGSDPSAPPGVRRSPTRDSLGIASLSISSLLLFSSDHPPITTYPTRVVELAVKSRLPALYASAEWCEGGGLMSYGRSFPDTHRRLAVYVDKILKGAKPADLPVEQPTKFELVINLKTAKQIGVEIPPEVLARATKLIK